MVSQFVTEQFKPALALSTRAGWYPWDEHQYQGYEATARRYLEQAGWDMHRAVMNHKTQQAKEDREAAVRAAVVDRRPIENEAYRLGQRDKALPEGTRICVVGHGRGSYVSFGKKTFGANEHTIAFDSGETAVVKLKKDEWTVKEDEMGAMDPVRPLSITVTTIFGHATVLEVRASQTIGAVKTMIEEQHGIPAARQRLLFNHQPLYDGLTLQRSGVEDGAALSLVLRLQAGPEPGPEPEPEPEPEAGPGRPQGGPR